MKRTSKEIEASKDYPEGVFHCSPTNSTAFTNCCHVAICDDEKQCPSCGLYVVGWDSSSRGNVRFSHAYRRGKK